MTYDLTTLIAKIDALVAKDNFTATEIADIKASVLFTQSIKANPATLQKMSDAYEWAEGFVKVTQKIGLVIAFIVILWANGERIIDFIRGGRP